MRTTVTGWLVALAAVATVALPSDTPKVEAQEASPEVAFALNHAADAYGVGRGCLWTIARRESRYQPWQDNWQGSGAAGLMQFKAGTYRWMAGQAGFPTDPGFRYDAWSAAHVAAWAIRNGYLSHWGGWC